MIFNIPTNAKDIYIKPEGKLIDDDVASAIRRLDSNKMDVFRLNRDVVRSDQAINNFLDYLIMADLVPAGRELLATIRWLDGSSSGFSYSQFRIINVNAINELYVTETEISSSPTAKYNVTTWIKTSSGLTKVWSLYNLGVEVGLHGQEISGLDSNKADKPTRYLVSGGSSVDISIASSKQFSIAICNGTAAANCMVVGATISNGNVRYSGFTSNYTVTSSANKLSITNNSSTTAYMYLTLYN